METLKQTRKLTQEETGCLMFEVTIDAKDSDKNRLVVMEKWKSMEDLDLNLKTEYFGALQASLEKHKIKVDLDIRKSCL